MTVICWGVKVVSRNVSVGSAGDRGRLSGGSLQFRHDSGALQRGGYAGLGEELFSSLGMAATMDLPFLHKLWHATNSLTCVKSNYYEG